MLRTSLLFLLDSRYEEEKAKKLYEDVKNNTPDKVSTELKIHLEKLDDIMQNYNSQENGYDLRNLISYQIIPLLQQEK